ALLAAVIAAFSLEDRPPAVPQGLPADVLFDGGLASSKVGEIVHAAPDRRVGSAGDARTAAGVAAAFHGFGFTTTVDRFQDGGTAASRAAPLARRAFRGGLGGQGALRGRGLPAIRLSGSGERAPPAAHRHLADLNATRYGELGRSALRVLSALDTTRATPPH